MTLKQTATDTFNLQRFVDAQQGIFGVRLTKSVMAESIWYSFVSSALLATYRKHACLAIMVVAAIITPPDLMTLLLVSLPLYVLYEVSIRVARWVEK